MAAFVLAQATNTPINLRHQITFLLVGINRFMSECRALTNLIGNGVATVVISRWEKEVSGEHVRAQLADGGDARP